MPALPFLSGRLDLNQRPPVPQTGALTRLRHAPMDLVYSAQIRIRSESPCLIFRSVSTAKTGGAAGGTSSGASS